MDTISRQWLMECVNEGWIKFDTEKDENRFIHLVRDIAPSAQPDTYEEKLKEIADELSKKFAYLNTCLNERDIILGYLGVKRPRGIHCDTDCTNTKCESNHCYKKSLTEPAQPEQQWIPVTERLPEEFGVYLATLDYKEHGKCVRALWYHGKQVGWDLRVADVVVAWLPLPEPWKGEENEHND